MPRKDPITGCQVLTIGEFFAAEARHKGTTPAHEFEETMNDISQMIAEDEKQIRKLVADPAEALKLILEALPISNEGLESEEIVEAPTVILETFDFEFSESLRSSSLKFKARCADGRTLAYSQSHTSGSRMEPPDGETIVEVVK